MLITADCKSWETLSISINMCHPLSRDAHIDEKRIIFGGDDLEFLLIFQVPAFRSLHCACMSGENWATKVVTLFTLAVKENNVVYWTMFISVVYSPTIWLIWTAQCPFWAAWKLVTTRWTELPPTASHMKWQTDPGLSCCSRLNPKSENEFFHLELSTSQCSWYRWASA